jgi:hypothetical protein
MLTFLTWVLFVPLMFGLWVVLGLVLLPFLMLRIVFRVLAALVIVPVVLVFGVLGLLVVGVAVTAAVLVPLVPFALALLLLWLILKAAQPRVV